jgi:hypothetical protein
LHVLFGHSLMLMLAVFPAGAAYSYCLKWGGMYRPTNGKPVSVIPGQVYGMRVLLEAPLAAADKEAGMQPRHVPVSSGLGFAASGLLASVASTSEAVIASMKRK